jgi:hypothetical protein
VDRVRKEQSATFQSKASDLRELIFFIPDSWLQVLVEFLFTQVINFLDISLLHAFQLSFKELFILVFVSYGVGTHDI